MCHNWRASLEKFCRLKVLLMQFFRLALSVTFVLVHASCNFVLGKNYFMSFIDITKIKLLSQHFEIFKKNLCNSYNEEFRI